MNHPKWIITSLFDFVMSITVAKDLSEQIILIFLCTLLYIVYSCLVMIVLLYHLGIHPITLLYTYFFDTLFSQLLHSFVFLVFLYDSFTHLMYFYIYYE